MVSDECTLVMCIKYRTCDSIEFKVQRKMVLTETYRLPSFEVIFNQASERAVIYSRLFKVVYSRQIQFGAVHDVLIGRRKKWRGNESTPLICKEQEVGSPISRKKTVY